MASYSEEFPNIYVDNSNNLQIDSDSVSISSGAINTTSNSVTTNQPFISNNTIQLENNILLKNQNTSNGASIPAGYVGIGFEEDIPFFSSPDFSSVKYVDARSTRRVVADTDLDINDNFVLLAGTSVDPVIVTLPVTTIDNSNVYYVGGFGTYYGQVQSGNVDLVVYNVNDGTEIFRGDNLDLDTGVALQFTYTIISTDPLVDQWSTGIQV
ncbi:hypothetical protein AB832_08160 [Flavobacteriaceae bacterium (ex Bugula neritina AB1)]|jgi:hypothetical protein|nr:hypothetical protein AB832_08160 [Flavobacteriaceae bacterium (ex Bugula neritina AB1)]